MKKRPSSAFHATPPPKDSPSVPPRHSYLADIHRKITSSAALNGGFDTLLYKIDKIEQNQGHLVNKVDKIHDAIYDPSDGIFSKLSEHKLQSNQKINEVEQDIVTIKAWRENISKDESKNTSLVQDAHEKVDKLESTVEHLSRNNNALISVLKWLGVAIGGGIITLIFNYLSSKIH